MATEIAGVRVFAPEGMEPDAAAVAQLRTCMLDEHAVAGALLADHHVGYSMPIGGVVAYAEAISPSGVGYDIGCGNKAVRTNIAAADFFGADADDPASRVARTRPLMQEVAARVSFGMGRSNLTPIDDHPFFERNRALLADLDRLAGRRAALSQKARAQLGTVGGGNHYVDVLVDEEGFLWVANHFGSRGFGHTVATGFLNLADNKPFDERGKDKEEPTVIPTSSDLGQLYIAAMQAAGEYAYAGRDYVIDQVLGVLGNPAVTLEVHNHHNFAWREASINMGDVWVVRKGATPLTGGLAFIGGSMGDWSFIVRGDGSDLGNLGSAPHGAGRLMSRTKAAGKFKRFTVYECNDRNCEFRVTAQAFHDARTPISCPTHPDGKLLRRQRQEQKSEGVVNWDAVQRRLDTAGIALVGGGADEAPEVYKGLERVIAAHGNIEVVHRLWPIGVVMGGPDTFDPYKD